MTADTNWQPGASLTMTLTGHWRLTGQVLAAEPPRRLSYTLDDPPGSPSVYVTWELHGTSDGTIIRLNVDEPSPLPDNTEDLESAWLPVLASLVNHLEQGPSSPTDRTQ
jgi:uncharacterized protein YndB with AHSA1/START domain